MTADELIDYLTMLSWSALCGIVEVNGSPGAVPSEPAPVAHPSCLTERMSEPLDLPSLWSHEPHEHLKFRPGDLVADIDADATPVSAATSKMRRPCRRSAMSASPSCRRSSTRTAAPVITDRCCSCCRGWTPPARAAS